MFISRALKFAGWTTTACTLSILILYQGLNPNELSFRHNTLRGLAAATLIAVLCKSILYGGKVRYIVNERLAKVISLLFIIYLFFLIVVYFNNPKDGLSIINWIYPEYSGVRPPQFIVKTKSCAFNIKELLRDIDEYFLCHSLGYFIMTVMTKDVKITFVLGVMDEIFEFTARDVVPLFGECWFDQLFYDIIITNLSGLLLGYLFLVKFNIRQNDIIGGDVFFVKCPERRKLSLWKRISSLKVFHSSKRLFVTCFIVLFKSSNLIVTFLLLDVLWIPIVSVFSIARLAVWMSCWAQMIHEIHVQHQFTDGLVHSRCILFYSNIYIFYPKWNSVLPKDSHNISSISF